MSSTALATKPKDKLSTLKRLLEEMRPSMAAVLPRHLTPDRMAKIALVAASRTPLLLECDSGTILHSVMNAAQLGLDCGGALGSAYLIPFKNKNGKYECQLIIGYKGMIDLARRSGEIETIEAHIVYQNDTFQVEYGLAPVLKHIPLFTGDRGKPVLVYAIARLKDGGRQTEVMTVADVERIRAKSRAGASGPWVTDWGEMARKTVVKRLCKYLPISVEAQERIFQAEAVDTTGSIDISALPEVEIEEIPTPPTKSETIAAAVANPTGPAEPTDVPLFDREPGQDG